MILHLSVSDADLVLSYYQLVLFYCVSVFNFSYFEVLKYVAR